MVVQDVRMPPPAVPSFWTAQSRVRVRTLILLRWLAIVGQTSAVLFVRYGLNVEFPLGWALAAIGVSIALNVGLIASRRSQELAREWEAAAQLAFDVIQLAVLLALTGGIQNPFVFLFVAPVAVSATILRPAVTAMCCACRCRGRKGFRSTYRRFTKWALPRRCLSDLASPACMLGGSRLRKNA